MNKGIKIQSILGDDKPKSRRTDSNKSRSVPESRSSWPLWITRDYALSATFGDKQKESLYHELGVLLLAGIDIKSCFDMLIAQQNNKQVTKICCQIQQALIGGRSLGAAMEEHPVFTPYEYHSVRIGEETGKLANILNDLAIFYRKRLKLRRQISGALTYPAIVLTTSMAAVIFMINFVVPMFADIFKRSGGDLPAITQFIVTLSDGSRKYAFIIILALAAITIWLYLQRKNERHRYWSSWLILRLPVFGTIIRKIYLARFCHSMALLTGSKIPLLRAVQLCRKMVGFYPIEQSLAIVEARVMQGSAFYEALAAFPIYDTKLTALIKVGEEVNQLADFFTKIAEQYQDDVEYKSAAISAIMEPAIIIVLGIIVGLILIAMYLPMFQMGDILG